MKFITGNETEPVTRTRVTWMLVVEPASGELTSRARGSWEHVLAQLRGDQADPLLSGKRLGLIRTDTIEIEHPVKWLGAGSNDLDDLGDDTPGTAAWYAESKLHGCTGTGYNAEDDSIEHATPGPCPVHPGLPD